MAIQAVTSSSRCGPSRQRRTRPTFSVLTRPAPSRTPTCFLIPVRVIPKVAASSLMEAPPRPRRSRMPRRVWSASAANAASSPGEY